MAIQKLRDGSEGIVAKIIVGLIIVVFALFGFGSITTFLTPVPKVASVAGVDITLQEMEIAVERNRRMLLANNQPVDEDTLRNGVLDRLIQRTLLATAAENYNLHYSDQMMDAAILQTPAFQIDGAFNPEQFQMVIGSAGFSPISYRNEVRRDETISQLTQAITATAFVTRNEARAATSLADQKRDIAYLRVPAADLLEVVEVTDEQVRAHYGANPDDYMTEETVAIEYVELRQADLLQRVELTEDEIRNHFESDKGAYTKAERRRVSHILIEINDDTDVDEAESRVKEIADKLAAGADFAELARTESADTGSGAEGGDLGFQEAGTFVPEFEEVAQSLTVGEVSDPVKTQFGFHILKLTGIEPEAIPEFGEIRDKVEADLRKGKAEELFIELSDRLGELAYESVDLVAPAEAIGAEIKSLPHTGRSASAGIMGMPGVAEAAFGDQVLIDGHNSEVIAVGPTHNVVVRVIEHEPTRQRPLEEVRDEIAAELREKAAHDLALARAREMVAMLDSGSLTRFVADEYGLEWVVSEQTPRQKAGIDRDILAEAFRLRRPADGGKSVGAVALANGDAAVVSVTKVDNAPEDGADVEQLRLFARALAGRRGVNDYLELQSELERGADIERF